MKSDLLVWGESYEICFDLFWVVGFCYLDLGLWYRWFVIMGAFDQFVLIFELWDILARLHQNLAGLHIWPFLIKKPKMREFNGTFLAISQKTNGRQKEIWSINQSRYPDFTGLVFDKICMNWMGFVAFVFQVELEDFLWFWLYHWIWFGQFSNFLISKLTEIKLKIGIKMWFSNIFTENGPGLFH